jgi:hypothetical protein
MINYQGRENEADRKTKNISKNVERSLSGSRLGNVWCMVLVGTVMWCGILVLALLRADPTRMGPIIIAAID